MIRNAIISLIMTLVVSTNTYALDDSALLSIIQQECVQVGQISIGVGKSWSNCHVTKGRWMGTIGLIDMYQAQYCLGKADTEACDNRALLVFGNRAYTPKAKLLVQRIDPALTTYDDPLIIVNEYGRILTLSAHLPDESGSKRFYLWQDEQWQLIDTNDWLQELSKKLPSGITARQGGFPDVDTMTAQLSLYRKGDKDCCHTAGVAHVELGVLKEHFILKSVNITNDK